MLLPCVYSSGPSYSGSSFSAPVFAFDFHEKSRELMKLSESNSRTLRLLTTNTAMSNAFRPTQEEHTRWPAPFVFEKKTVETNKHKCRADNTKTFLNSDGVMTVTSNNR
jgi:hypothetical protein